MQDPTEYNKQYFMASATYWYLEHHTTTGWGYNEDDIIDAMDDVGVPDKYQKEVLTMVEEFDL